MFDHSDGGQKKFEFHCEPSDKLVHKFYAGVFLLFEKIFLIDFCFDDWKRKP